MIVETTGYYKKGVHFQEPKRIKQSIRKYLGEAEKRVRPIVGIVLLDVDASAPFVRAE